MQTNKPKTEEKIVPKETVAANNPSAKTNIKALRDLDKEDVSKLTKAKVTFRKIKTKSGSVLSRIYIDLGHHMLDNIEIKYNGNSITTDRFNAILVETNTTIIDALGKPIDTITRNVPVRFIKGINAENPEQHYHCVELIFKKFLYNVHFFTSDQIRIINSLSEKKEFKLDFIDYTYNKNELNDFNEAVEAMEF